MFSILFAWKDVPLNVKSYLKSSFINKVLSKVDIAGACLPLQKQPPRVLYEKRRSATSLKKRLWHRCFPVNLEKFLRRPFLQNISGGLLLCQTENTPKFSCLKNIFGKILKSLIVNVDFKSWNYCIPRRYRLRLNC